MSKHTEEERKVEDLLRTLTNSDELTVSNINRPFVHFTAQQGIVEYLQSLIGVPLNLASKLWRAVKGVEPKVEIPIDKHDSDEQYESLSDDDSRNSGESGIITLPSSNELLRNIITPECVDSLGLESFEESDYSIVSSTTQSKSTIVAKRVESGANLIGFALNDPAYIMRVLNHEVDPLSKEEDFDLLRETDEVPDQNVFCVVRTDKTVTAKFNTARFVQLMQLKGYYSLSESSPIIAKLMTAEDTYSLNLDHLQFYIGSKIAPMVFQPTKENDQLRLKPIALYNTVGSSQETHKVELGIKSLFSIVLDVSGSMHSNLPLCKEKLYIILEQIVNATENWTISITQFNQRHSSKVFESSGDKVRDLKTLSSYIRSFSADGETNLLGTMHDKMVGLRGMEYARYASIVFTDGVDTCKVVSQRDVIQTVCKTKEQLSNLQIFTLELGSENLEFFNALELEAGCTHIRLTSMSDMSEFTQYTKSLSLSSKVVQFLLDSQKLYQMTVIEGQVGIGAQLVPTNTKIIIEGEPYYIQWPTESFDTFDRSLHNGGEIQLGGNHVDGDLPF